MKKPTPEEIRAEVQRRMTPLAIRQAMEALDKASAAIETAREQLRIALGESAT